MKTRGPFTLLLALVALILSAPAGAASRPLTPSERQQINATIDVFVNHAVKRQNVDAAYDAVTPNFRLGMSRKEWDKGDIPGFPYPAAGHTFHGWVVNYHTGNELGIQLILMPRKGSGVGAGSFPITLKKLHGRWLVDSMVPGAFFAPEGKRARVVGTNDFGPGSSTGDGGAPNTPSINPKYAYVPFILFGVMALVLLSLALIGGFRYRRQRGTLPPLPIRRSRSGA